MYIAVFDLSMTLELNTRAQEVAASIMYNMVIHVCSQYSIRR